MDLADRHWPVLVTGARGLLGSALGPRLERAAPDPAALALTDVEDLDVTDPAAVRRAIGTVAPKTVINLAGWTDVDGAEAHPDAARRLNVEAPALVAAAAAEVGALMVHLSTDFVFDGMLDRPYVEDDPPTAVSVYGASKAEGELRVREAAPGRHLLVRTAWLYGAGGRNFVDAVLDRARAGAPLRVVTDQVGCPTWSEDLAGAIVELVAADARGTVHACGEGACSRWNLAREAVAAASLDVEIEPLRTADLPNPGAPRPSRAALDTTKLERTLGHRLPPWPESVRAYVASRR